MPTQVYLLLVVHSTQLSALGVGLCLKLTQPADCCQQFLEMFLNTSAELLKNLTYFFKSEFWQKNSAESLKTVVTCIPVPILQQMLLEKFVMTTTKVIKSN